MDIFQAAPSMKAVVVALWLLTSAVGDGLIVLITLINLFDNMAIELLFYAGAMLIVMGIFALISIFYYKYNNSYTTEKNRDDDISGTDNSGFDENNDDKPKLQ
jgi:hypothetical protein